LLGVVDEPQTSNIMTKSNSRFRLTPLALALFLTFGLVGCEQDSPAEDAAEDVSDTMESAADEVEDKAEDVGDEVDDEF
jgi:hypothetical protein